MQIAAAPRAGIVLQHLLRAEQRNLMSAMEAGKSNVRHARILTQLSGLQFGLVKHGAIRCESQNKADKQIPLPLCGIGMTTLSGGLSSRGVFDEGSAFLLWFLTLSLNSTE